MKYVLRIYFFQNVLLIYHEKKREVFEKKLGSKCTDFIKSILFFIIKNKRTNILIQIFEEFNSLFHKEKNIVKDQINLWSIETLKDLIVEINNVEYNIKRNSAN